jgi:hypothetical protein
MRLIFIYGPVASGKLTIARLVGERTGIPLFHNHLIVDAVAAVFPFGSKEFVMLRERFWLETISTAAETGQSLIFTFAPEPTVAGDFPDRVSRLVQAAGGEVIYVALDLPPDEQERRLVDPTRAAFGKLRSPEILRSLRASMAACMKAMPSPAIRIDTGAATPAEAADAIIEAMERIDRTNARATSAG